MNLRKILRHTSSIVFKIYMFNDMTFTNSDRNDSNLLTLSSIYMYTHSNTLKKKLQENIVEKGEIAQNEQFRLFPQYFLCNLCRRIL